MEPHTCVIGRVVCAVMIGLGLLLSLYALFVLTPATAGRAAVQATAGAEWSPGSIEVPNDIDHRKVELGRILFEDPRLSGDGSRSCASCHDLETNGALAGERETTLDTPTIFNVGLNYRFGWTGAFRTLEGQALATIESPLMTGGRAPGEVYARIAADPALSREFARIYGRQADGKLISDVLAEFERSLVTPSRFDRWLEGDEDALTSSEQQGYRIFSRLGCQSCHQGRNLGGNLMQRHGIFRPLASPEPALVRVPSLRNVAETAPYFHDGSAPTLDDAIRRMAAAQLNRDLTPEQVRLLAEFLGSLTGTYKCKRVHRP